jgi:hypothetical protein
VGTPARTPCRSSTRVDLGDHVGYLLEPDVADLTPGHEA